MLSWRRAVFAAFVLAASPLSAQTDVDDPLGFLEPLIGTWIGVPEWIALNPGMDRMIPIAFRWGTSRRSILEQSGLPVDGRLFTTGLIAWDPVSQRVEFTSSQGNDDLLFTGFYEPVGDGDVQRTYEVKYPDGNIVRFRETFFFDGPDRLDWLTEWEQGGVWVPRRGNGDPEFRAERLKTAPDRVAGVLSSWLGAWVDPSGARIEIRTTEGGSGADITISDGAGRLLEGLVYLDPHVGALRSTLLGDDGGVLQARVEAPAPATLEWTLEEFRPDGTITSGAETWRLDGRCIVRTTTPTRAPTTDQRLCSEG